MYVRLHCLDPHFMDDTSGHTMLCEVLSEHVFCGVELLLGIDLGNQAYSELFNPPLFLRELKQGGGLNN